MKRICSLLLALLMTLALLPALAEDAPTVITVSGPDSVNSHWTDTLAVQYLEKVTNTQWDVTLYPADVWKTKLTLMITDDNLPDVIFKASADKAEMNQYGEQGYFLDLSQYLDIMPNLQAAFEKYPEYKAYHSTETGAIYSLANMFGYEGQRAQPLVYINKVWLKNVGLEVPETVEDLYTVLKAFKEQDANGNGDPNDELPMSFETSAGQRMQHLIQAAFGIYSTAVDMMLGVDENGKVFLNETTENFKNYVKYMHQLFAEGLMDETTFIQTPSERREKIKNGVVGMFSDWSGLLENTCGESVPGAYDTWKWIYGLGSKDTPIAYPAWPMVQVGCQILVSANTKHPEAVCKIIDTLFTDEYIQVYNVGIEGETFEYITTLTGAKMPVIMKSAWEGKYDSQGVFVDQYVNVTQMYTITYSPVYAVIAQATPEQLEQMKNDPDLCNNAYREELVQAGYMKDTYPVFSYTAEEADVQSRYKGDLTSYLQTMRVAFITGEADIDAEWDTFQATIQAMGLNELLAAEQSAYDRYAVNLK